MIGSASRNVLSKRTTMASLFWTLGRTLQVVAMIQVAVALIWGIQSQDATLELKLLLFGILEFLLGNFLLERSGRQS